jgi:hypothetical protein
VTQRAHLWLRRRIDRLLLVVSSSLVPMGSENILIWNVRGLNAQSHHDAIRELVRAKHLSIVCFQETKLNVITDFDLI